MRWNRLWGWVLRAQTKDLHFLHTPHNPLKLFFLGHCVCLILPAAVSASSVQRHARLWGVGSASKQAG